MLMPECRQDARSADRRFELRQAAPDGRARREAAHFPHRGEAAGRDAQTDRRDVRRQGVHTDAATTGHCRRQRKTWSFVLPAVYGRKARSARPLQMRIVPRRIRPQTQPPRRANASMPRSRPSCPVPRKGRMQERRGSQPFSSARGRERSWSVLRWR
jgi:hypothetical protein